MKALCTLVLVLGLIAISGLGCKASAEVGDAQTSILSPR
jgi:hypothetical protein